MTEVKELLITGCGRSGTKHTANFLRKVKFKVKHEQMSDQGTVSGPFVGYGTDAGDIVFRQYQKFGHKSGEYANQFEFKRVWHQVRHPLKVIGSLRDVMLMPVKLWSQAAFGQDVGLGKRGDLAWAVEHYLITTKLADKAAHWMFKVEELREVYTSMADDMGIPVLEMPDVSTTMNRSQRTIKVFRPVAEVYAEIQYPTIQEISDVVGKSKANSVTRRIEKYGYV